MRILLIDVYHYNKGGAETVCFNTGAMLEEQGHQVVYFTLKWDNNLPSKYEKYFPESKETRKGIFRQFINLRNYFYYPEAAKNIEKLILETHPDIAHIHLMWGQISPSIFPVLKKYNIPIVFTIHDYRIVCPAYCFKNGFGKICEACNGKDFYKCFTHKCTKGSYFLSFFMAAEQYFRNKFFNPCQYLNGLIYVSQFSQEKHEKYMPGLMNIPHIVMHNFSLTQTKKVENKKEKYLLFLGRLSEEKGIMTLIKSFKYGISLPIKIAGTGPLEKNIKEYISENHINNIELLGYKQGEELTKLIKEAYFIIVPSECYENNPMSIIEAYSYGIPVIGSKIGGIPEIIKEKETGYTFQMGNSKELAKLIKQIESLSDEEYLHLCKNCIAYAKEDMSKESYYKRLISFYKRILSQKK